MAARFAATAGTRTFRKIIIVKVSIACGERGPSNFNQDQRLVTSLLYEPPIGKGQAFLTHGIASEVLGGWQFNAIFTIASGFPFTFTESANLLNGGGGASGGGGGRPNYSGATLAPTGGKNRFHWFNPAGYKAPAALRVWQREPEQHVRSGLNFSGTLQ